MELADSMIFCLLLFWPHLVESQGNSSSSEELNRGPLDGRLKDVKPSLSITVPLVVEAVDLFTAGETTNLRWITADKAKQIPLDAFSIFNNYTSRKEYVCRPKNVCALGFMTETKGFYCYYSLQGHQLLTNNFQFLQNRKNFELLEWKADRNGSVPKYSIKNCQHNFVGRNKYGLGNVHSEMQVFFLPWEGKEYWYEEYEVLTVNRDPYHLRVFKISYDTKKSNVSTFPSEQLMETKCVPNKNDTEIVTEVFMQTRHEKVSIWEPSLIMPLMLSTNFSVKVPEITLGRGDGSRVRSNMSSFSGYKYRENVSLTLHQSIVIQPHQCCAVKMLGKNTLVTMPFWAQVTKVYLNGMTHNAAIVGRYKSVEMAGTSGELGTCTLINKTSEKTQANQPVQTTDPGNAAVVLSPGQSFCIILSLCLTSVMMNK